MTEILMMTLTPQLRKIAIKKSIKFSINLRTRDNFSTLSRQAEVTMKLKDTESLKLQTTNEIQTNTSKYRNI